MVHVHCIVHAKKKLLVKEIDFHPIPQIKKEENPHPHLQERNSNHLLFLSSVNPPPPIAGSKQWIVQLSASLSLQISKLNLSASLCVKSKSS